MQDTNNHADDHYLALPAGTTIGHFSILRLLGQGGFSLVYLAWDDALKREVAIKEYLPSQLATRTQNQTVVPQGTKHRQAFEEGLNRFVEEAQLLAKLNHPAIVRLLEIIETAGTAYIVMPYYHGQTLKEYQAQTGKRWTQAELLTLLEPLLDALSLLHNQNVLHRDIAPDNIFLLDNGYPVLIDFGAARRVVGEMTESLTLMVKPGYSPIEQYSKMGKLATGPWSDVYSLAAVIYELCCGESVYDATDRVPNDQMPTLKQRKPGGFNMKFISAVDSALSVNAQNRPQSISQWAQSLLTQSVTPKQVKPKSLFGWRQFGLIGLAIASGWWGNVFSARHDIQSLQGTIDQVRQEQDQANSNKQQSLTIALQNAKAETSSLRAQLQKIQLDKDQLQAEKLKLTNAMKIKDREIETLNSDKEYLEYAQSRDYSELHRAIKSASEGNESECLSRLDRMFKRSQHK